MSKSKKAVGSVCLYGSQSSGFGYLAGPDSNPAQFGDGEPRPGSATSAMWSGLLDLERAGFSGLVEVYASGGQQMAIVDNSKCVLPYFGELKWGPAKVYVISVEAIKAAAVKG